MEEELEIKINKIELFERVVQKLTNKNREFQVKFNFSKKEGFLNLYLKYDDSETKYNGKLNILHLKSKFDNFEYFGLKGKKDSVDKKTLETTIINTESECDFIINKTIESLKNVSKPIKIEQLNISHYTDENSEDRIRVYLKKNHRINKFKIESNFLIYKSEGKFFVELDEVSWWLYSRLFK